MAEVYKGDNGTLLTFTVKDERNKTVNLTGATVTMKIKKASDIPLEEKVANIVNASEGICSVTLFENDLDIVSRYTFQLTVLLPNSNKYSTNPVGLQVLEVLE